MPAADRPPRRHREALTRSDGTTVTPAKAPRADLLWYPHHRLTTVLVRRTHDLDLARRLAEQRWTTHRLDRAAAGNGRCVVLSVPPLARHRVGWWSTSLTPRRCPPEGAQDQDGRVVTACADLDHGASPGIEFRP